MSKDEAEETDKKSRKQKAADDDLADIDAEIRKNYGAGALSVASEAKALRVDRLRTGIFAFDHVFGGGFPKRKIITYFGMQASGKSTAAALLAAAFQRHCRNCSTLVAACSCKGGPVPMRVIWFDAEGAWGNDWAQSLGVQLNLTRVIRVESAEQGIDIADFLLRTGKFDLLVVDSIAQLTPMVEIEESMEKSQIASQAKLVNKALRKWIASLNSFGLDTNKGPSVLLINQIRYKAGLVFGNPETRPGGMGQYFASTAELRFEPGKFHYVDANGAEVKAKDKITDGMRPAWMDVSFESIKNRTFAPRVGGSFRLFLSNVGAHHQGEVYEIDQLIEQGKIHGLVKQEGRSWECGKLKASSEAEFKQLLTDDTEGREGLVEALLSVMLA